MKLSSIFHVGCCLVLVILGGCGERPSHEKFPQGAIALFADLANRNVPWDVLSYHGTQVVDAIWQEGSQTERVRQLKELQRVMRSLEFAQGDSGIRLRRIWALQGICHRMRECWWCLGMPEMVVEDGLFILQKYKEELQKADAGTPRPTEYDKVLCGLESMARIFETHVLPRAMSRLTPEQLKSVQNSFFRTVGRNPASHAH